MSSEQSNKMLVSLGYRGYRLLEKHSMSGAWVVIGAVAALGLTQHLKARYRTIIVLIYGSMLLIGLNFINIVAYVVVVIFVYFDGFRIFTGKVNKELMFNVCSFVAILISGLILVAAYWNNEFTLFMSTFFPGQLNVLFGLGDSEGRGFFNLIIEYINAYGSVLAKWPAVLILGDGFSGFGLPKGGDIGWIESMLRFGIPMFLLVTFGLWRLFRNGLKSVVQNQYSHSFSGDEIGQLKFALAGIMAIILNDFHYTVWGAKSIFPIFVCALAILGYQHDRRKAILTKS